ncbi:ankyrin repeat [Cedratvirus lausannensis]|uniref:Ankyrin repeat n=1 Tax=Cedratvirus lausannensis TaxID=2023205 RepID=A0A285Q2D9_9VIRU|nr:ankyrin repeat [Cedratvirus lausannensis]
MKFVPVLSLEENTVCSLLTAENGHLKVLQWARANGCEWDEWTCINAAKNNQVKVLEWLKEQGWFSPEKLSQGDWSREACYRAAEGGYLQVLQ